MPPALIRKFEQGGVAVNKEEVNVGSDPSGTEGVRNRTDHKIWSSACGLKLYWLWCVSGDSCSSIRLAGGGEPFATGLGKRFPDQRE